jgi:hypothetical protein
VADLSPAAQAIWDAFNATAERVGTFEDYGDALAAALRAAADQVVPERDEPVYGECDYEVCDVVIHLDQQRIRRQLLTLATELEAH